MEKRILARGAVFVGVLLVLSLLSACHAFEMFSEKWPPDRKSSSSSPSVVQEDFTKYTSNPILSATEAWEGIGLGECSIILDSGIFKMWYRGGDLANGQIGYATSTNGLNWTKYGGNPVITNISGVDSITCPYVLKVGLAYYLYAIKGSSLYRWTSSDGIVWAIDNSGSSVLSQGLGWDAYVICNAAILYEAGETYPWKMLFEATGTNATQIGYAYSLDGLNWIKSVSNPVLLHIGSGWKANATGTPELIKIEGVYYAIYGGHKMGWSIGISRSLDMITWTDALNNPVIETNDLWEGNEACDPSIVYDVTGKTYKVYLYYRGDYSKLGVATLQNINLKTYLDNHFN
jgi:hypothetical protein